MAKQKGYESVMGSVFDFIFNESKKDPGKVKPLKVTGVDSSSKLSDAMVSALEKPLLFVNDTTMGAFEDMMSSDLLAIRYGKGERDNVKITTKDLGNALKNPSGFLDKAFEKIEANQKVNMASWAGDSIRAVLAGTWARKHNLDVETQMAMAVMHNAQDRTKQTTNFSPVPVAEMGERTGKLLEKYLGENSTLTDADILKRFGREDATTKKAKIEKWKKDYQEGGRKNLLYSKEVYAFVEGQELMEKSKEARENNDKEKAKNYYRASRYLDALQGEDEYKNFKRRSLRRIKSYKDAIVKLKVGTDPQKDVKIREIENQIKMLNGQIASGRLYQLAGNIGRFQGMYGSMKGVHEYTVGGSLAGALITGDFFDPNKNKTWLCPTDATAKKTLKDSSVAGFSKLSKSGGGVGFRIAAKTGNKFIDGYNEQMLRFYYSSPIVGIKSLATGEVFARRAYEEMNKFNRRFGQKIPGFDMKELFDKDGNVVEVYLGQIMGVASEDQKEALAKFLKSNERWNKMALRFSAIKRRQDAIGGYFDAKIGKNFRKSFASFLLKNRAFSQASKEILGEWIEKGGIQVLAKVFGVTVSGLAGPLAPIISKFVSDTAVNIGMAIAKPIFKFSFQWIFFFFFGLLGFVILMTMNDAIVLGVNSGESPRDVVKCKDIKDEPGHGGGDPKLCAEEMETADLEAHLGPIPSSSFAGSCPFPTGLRCSQGSFGNFSHSNVQAVDLVLGPGGIFHAPAMCSSVSCQVLSVGKSMCAKGYGGGKVVVQVGKYTFKLLHVKTNLVAGTLLRAGQAIAAVMSVEETTHCCSSGAHLHLEVSVGGVPRRPEDIMNAAPFNCGFSACPN